MLKNKRKNRSIIQKLYNRVVSGSFTNNLRATNNEAKLLFGSIPPRLRFHLKTIIKDMGKHILMGMTQCGQFILTYTFTMDQIQSNNGIMYGSSCFKYQLHWWKFKINAPATRVAEVRLFENQDILDVLTIGVAQWPTVSNKILIYGQGCPAPQETDASEFRKIYMTIAVNPSLSHCEDCQNVKKMSIAENDWNAALSSRCLKHGLTVHTVLSVFPPFPAVNLLVALKFENHIVVNTGNSFHVLFMDLDESNFNVNSNYVSEGTIINERVKHRLETSSALHDLEYKIPLTNSSSENSKEQVFSNQKRRLVSWNKNNKVKSYVMCSDYDNQCENCKSDCDYSRTTRIKKSKSSSVPLAITKQAWMRQVANQVYDFAEPDESCNLKFKWYRRRTIADKMYEFCSEDEENTENIHPLSLHIGSANSLSILRTAVRKGCGSSSGSKSCDSSLEDGDRLSVTSQTSDNSDFSDSHLSAMSPISLSNCESTCKVLNRDIQRNCENENGNISKINQLKSNHSNIIGGSHQLNVTSDSIWLDWDTSSLSPCSDFINSECSELKHESTRSLHEMANAGSSESPSSKFRSVPSKAVKFYPDCTSNKDCSKPKDSPELNKFFVQKSGIGSFLKMRDRYSTCSNCVNNSKKDSNKMNIYKQSDNSEIRSRYLVPYVSTLFEKRYVEMDEEILSTITDVDDEDDVNYALPSSVHGTGYCQMHRVASNNIERLNIPSCVIRQDSLDFEQFSYIVAVFICKCQGYKFWFCSDYDVEIVDVCPLSGDILAVVLLRINASPPSDTTDQVFTKCAKDQRQFFETRALFIWNAQSRACWLEAYTSLTVDTSSLSHNIDRSLQRNPARTEAEKLRSLGLGFFDTPLLRPIRYFEHLVLDNIRFGPSMEVIEDELNMIAFFRNSDDTILNVVDDSDVDSLDFDEDHVSIGIDEEENYDFDEI